MRFELTILGCGAATPTLRRGNTAQLLNLHDQYLLIDCGEGTQLKLRRNRLKFQRIHHIFISHLHGDHYLGLPGLISSMHLYGRTKPLHIYCPEPLQELLELNLRYSDTYLNFDLVFHHHSKEGGVILEGKHYTVEAFPMKHRIACHGFRFQEKPKRRRVDKTAIEPLDLGVAEIIALRKGEDVVREDGTELKHLDYTLDPYPVRSYAYCGDTAPFERQVGIVQGATLLYHESTFLHDMKDRAKSTYHTTALQAGEIAAKAEARYLLLGHFSQRYDDTSLFKEEARTVFPETHCTHDGMHMELDAFARLVISSG